MSGEMKPVWMTVRRFVARGIDQIGLTLLLQAIPGVDMFTPVTGLLAFVLMIPVEAVLLYRFSTTPGKAILRLRVRPPANTPWTLRLALQRSVLVWLFGQGAGVVPLMLLGGVVAVVHLTERGATYWDRKLGTQVIGLHAT